MKPCRVCSHAIAADAIFCPQCGTPYPARDVWDGWGYEYMSPTRFCSLPLLHISFKYRPNRTPVVARGIIAIGQFACGIVTISQFGIGVLCLSQFALAGFALAQFACAWSLIAQMGLYVQDGHGQIVRNIGALLAKLL